MIHTGARTAGQKQDRRGSEKACCSRRDFTLPPVPPTSQPVRHNQCPECERVLQARIWTAYPPMHPQGQPIMKSSSSKKLWSSSETMDEQQEPYFKQAADRLSERKSSYLWHHLTSPPRNSSYLIKPQIQSLIRRHSWNRPG